MMQGDVWAVVVTVFFFFFFLRLALGVVVDVWLLALVFAVLCSSWRRLLLLPFRSGAVGAAAIATIPIAMAQLNVMWASLSILLILLPLTIHSGGWFPHLHISRGLLWWQELGLGLEWCIPLWVQK